MEEIYYGRQIASLEKRISNNFSPISTEPYRFKIRDERRRTFESPGGEQERKVSVDARQLVS